MAFTPPIKIDVESIRQAIEVAVQPVLDGFHRSSIAQEIIAEVVAAEAKHGRHKGMEWGTGPDVILPQIQGNHPLQTTEEWALLCKYITDKNAGQPTQTRANIILEEVAEAMEQDDPHALRAEAIQAAAMFMALVFDIDNSGALEE